MRTPVACAALFLLVNSQAEAQTSEARVGITLLASRQNVVGSAGLDRSTGTIRGAEFLAQNSGIGIYGRFLTGEIGTLSARGPDGRIRMADVRLLLGPPVFSVEGGYTIRTRSGSLQKPRDNLIRAGARSSLWLGPSRFSVSVDVSALGRSDQTVNGKKVGVVGWEGQSALMYQAPRRLPFYLLLGYRYERLRTEEESPPVQREEISSLVFGLGIRHLGFPKPGKTSQ